MGDAKRKATPSTEERVRRAEETGWAGFKAKLLAGNSVSGLDFTRALLGLGELLQQANGRYERLGESTGRVLVEFRTVIVNLLVREEMLAAHLQAVERRAALPFWRRWRVPRPVLQPFPALPASPTLSGNGPPTKEQKAIPAIPSEQPSPQPPSQEGAK
jgi:hypothetical protein